MKKKIKLLLITCIIIGFVSLNNSFSIILAGESNPAPPPTPPVLEPIEIVNLDDTLEEIIITLNDDK